MTEDRGKKTEDRLQKTEGEKLRRWEGGKMGVD